jgi:hypothetical protein
MQTAYRPFGVRAMQGDTNDGMSARTCSTDATDAPPASLALKLEGSGGTRPVSLASAMTSLANHRRSEECPGIERSALQR